MALRFEAHTFYQKEEEFLLHIEWEVPQDPHFLYLDEEHLKILHEIYMVLIPLQCCGKKFSETQEIQIFAKNSLYDESPSVQGAAFSEILQYASAQKAYRNAVSLNPNDIDAQLFLGGIQEKMGQSKEALPRNLKALALAQKKHGENHPDVATSYNNIGLVYDNLGEYDKALEFYQKALKILLKSYWKNHPYIETVLESLIICVKKASCYPVKELGEISVLCTQILGTEHPLAEQLAQLVLDASVIKFQSWGCQKGILT